MKHKKNWKGNYTTKTLIWNIMDKTVMIVRFFKGGAAMIELTNKEFDNIIDTYFQYHAIEGEEKK